MFRNGYMIKISKLSKLFGKTKILDEINLDVKRGETLSIIGSSGCGKSTLLKCINGLEKVSSGSITVAGEDITEKRTNLNKIRTRMGIVFQQFNLFPHMTVKQNIILAPIKVKKMKRNEAEFIAMELLERVGLLDKLDKYPDQLSGGQAQRVAIARCLAMQPDIMLFDEPTSALDPQMTIEVCDTLKDLANDDLTMVIVTHEMSLAKEISNNVAFLSKGKIIEKASPEEIFSNPKEPETMKFLESVKL